MYNAIQPITRPQNNPTGFMAAKGMNLKDLPQLLDINFALMTRNYISNAQGQLEKRKGYTELFNVGGTDPITMLEKWTDDLWMFSYGITTAVYRVSTGAITNIKTNWSAGNQNGQQYGDYFFVCNGVEKIHRISQTLNYDGETITFVVGGIVTGGISQATGVLLELLDSGTAGTLTLGNVRGVFQDNEPLTCSTGGAAVANGTLGFTATEIAASPKASTLAIIQGRLLCDDVDDSGILNYSAKDDGTNPPFNDWTVGTDATDAGRLTNRNIGRIRSIVPLGQFFYVLGDTGEFAFYIQVIDSAGALTKTDEFVTSRVSLGGARGAITTDQGIFLANEAGLWQTVSLGQQDVPFSKQSQLNSVNLGKKYFEDVDFSNSDIAYDEFNRLVLVTCAKDSIENNLVIVYNIDNQSFAEFTGCLSTLVMMKPSFISVCVLIFPPGKILLTFTPCSTLAVFFSLALRSVNSAPRSSKISFRSDLLTSDLPSLFFKVVFISISFPSRLMVSATLSPGRWRTICS
jgi:hypothetical protein